MGKLGIIISVMLMAMGIRLLWMSQPSLLLCISLWMLFLVLVVLMLTWRVVPYPTRFCLGIMGTGGLLNAMVTIANGGFMPTIGEVGGIYIHGGSLTWLGDMYWASSSPGDMLMAFGLILILTSTIFGVLKTKRRKNKLTPTIRVKRRLKQ